MGDAAHFLITLGDNSRAAHPGFSSIDFANARSFTLLAPSSLHRAMLADSPKKYFLIAIIIVNIILNKVVISVLITAKQQG